MLIPIMKEKEIRIRNRRIQMAATAKTIGWFIEMYNTLSENNPGITPEDLVKNIMRGFNKAHITKENLISLTSDQKIE